MQFAFPLALLWPPLPLPLPAILPHYCLHAHRLSSIRVCLCQPAKPLQKTACRKASKHIQQRQWQSSLIVALFFSSGGAVARRHTRHTRQCCPSTSVQNQQSARGMYIHAVVAQHPPTHITTDAQDRDSRPPTGKQASKQASARVERMNGWLAGWPQLPTIYMYVKCEVRLLARPTAVSTCQPPPRHPAANRGAPRQHPTIITFRFVWHQHQRRHKASVQSVVRARCSPPTPSMACTVRRLCCAAPPPILLLLVCCLSVCRTDTHAMRNPRR